MLEFLTQTSQRLQKMMKISDIFPFMSDEDADGRAYLDAILDEDWKKALPMLKAAAAREDATAMSFLGAFYAMGLGVEKDNVESTLWLRQAAIRGNVSAQAALGMCLAHGLGVAQDRLEAAYWLFKAGQAGSAISINTLAAMAYQHHEIVGPHFTEDELCELVEQLPRLMAKAKAKKDD